MTSCTRNGVGSSGVIYRKECAQGECSATRWRQGWVERETKQGKFSATNFVGISILSSKMPVKPAISRSKAMTHSLVLGFTLPGQIDETTRLLVRTAQASVGYLEKKTS